MLFLPLPRPEKKTFLPHPAPPCKKRLPRTMRIPCIESGTLFTRRSLKKVIFKSCPKGITSTSCHHIWRILAIKCGLCFGLGRQKSNFCTLNHQKWPFSVLKTIASITITSHTITSVFINAFQVLES